MASSSGMRRCVCVGRRSVTPRELQARRDVMAITLTVRDVGNGPTAQAAVA